MFKQLLLITIFIQSFSACSFKTDDQLYEDLLGKPAKNCVEIINSETPDKMDDPSTYLYFKLCPSELKRILTQRKYSKQIISKTEVLSHENISYGNKHPGWWHPSKLGDSCIWFRWFADDQDRAEVLYVSFDSTQVFYRDDRY